MSLYNPKIKPVEPLDYVAASQKSDSKVTSDGSIFASTFTQNINELNGLDLSEENIENALQTAESDKKVLLSYLKEIFSNAELKNSIDANKDGVISDAEARAFINSINTADGNADDISSQDFATTLESMGVTLNQTPPAEETPPAAEVPAESAAPAQSAGGASGSRRNSDGSFNNENIKNDKDLKNLADTLKGGSLTEQKEALEKEINDHESNIAAINDGSFAEVKNAADAEKAAKLAMDEAIANDEKISAELKTQHNEVSTALAGKNTELSKTKSDISAKNSQISQLSNSIATLESSLKSLAKPTGEEADKERDAQLEQRRKDLEGQIKQKQGELEKAKGELTKLEASEKQLEGEKTELEGQLKEIESQIALTAAPETQQAIDAYNEAVQNTETAKTTALSSEQTKLDTAIKNLSEVEAKIEAEKNTNAEKSVNFDFNDKLTDAQKADLEKFKQNYKDNEERYKAVSEKTGIPPELIAALHWRESSGNFDTYLHNGEKLGKKTTLVPKGIYFEEWEPAAIDALSSKSYGNVDAKDIDSYYEYAERYNGLGYRNRGLPSAYVWSGTDKYSSGKFVRDHVFDKNAIDKQLGVAAMLKSVMA